MAEPKRTPLFDAHTALGAKIVEFAGFLMPLQYSGLVDEHNAVRTSAGLFDVSHMGEIEIRGPNALKAVNHLITNDASKLTVGQALYTPMCYPHGGIVDDLLVYKRADDRFLLVVNAANTAKDFDWIRENLVEGAVAENLSDQFAQLALQGRNAVAILSKLTKFDVDAIEYYHFAEDVEVAGAKVLVSRTGYTGEDGFELYSDPEDALRLWDAIMEAGKEFGLKPAGLGARDTLRLEAKMVLYGNDITDKTNPIEAGLSWTVKLDKEEFIAKDVLERVKAEKPKRYLVGLEMLERGIARQHYKVYLNQEDEEPAGEITSGTMSPYLKKAIALAYVPYEHRKRGTRLFVEIHGKRREAQIVKTPFYKRDY